MKQEMQWHQLDHMQIICISLQQVNKLTNDDCCMFMQQPWNSIFYKPDAVPDVQPTVSKHLRQYTQKLSEKMTQLMFYH